MADIINKIESTPAVILAAGLGTRLRSVLPDKPKPMADVNGKPFLEYLIRRLNSYGITDIVVCVAYMGDQIIGYFSKNRICNIRFSVEESPMGTGGTLKNAESLIGGRFIMLYGDAYTLVDYADLLAFHIKSEADLTLTLFHGAGNKGGRVKLDGDRVIEFVEKGTETSPVLINGGVYIVEPSILDRIPAHKMVSFEKEIIPELLKDESIVVNGYISKSDVSIDIGEPETYNSLLQNTDVLEL